MNKKIIYGVAGVFIALLSLSIGSCKKTQISSPQLTAANMTDSIPAAGGTVALSFTCNGAWTIDTTGFGWLQLSQVSGTDGAATINLTAGANTTGISRSVLLYVSSTNGQARRITVLQIPVIFPSYNTSPVAPDATGMGSTAIQINANIKLGYNIWNTMEAPGGETGWGNPVITQSLIDTLKNAGFNAIRIPCQYWWSHANHTTMKIDTAWLSRVKQVVQYCINDGMYVVLNDHWDNGWLDCTASGAKLDTIKATQKAIWEQVATKMRDFDEHLMFASSNEPNANDMQSSVNLHDFHQIFINAVRSTGGKNAYRTLVIQAPSTSIDLANYFTPDGIPGMPYDAVPNKLILEVHYYSPPNFCIIDADVSWGKEWRYWGANFHSTDDTLRNSTAGTEEGYMDSTMVWVNKMFVSKNIPVLIGEFGVADHSKNCPNPKDSILSLTSTAHFYGELVRSARANGVSPFLWAGVINRQNETIGSRQQLDSMRKAAGY
ncbi:xyloglucan-specific endo-beta-1,4-glucanase BoGH5A precursor [mine drainage metagenome]|uniref:Xyloglucan-specific endo-beta-1,4-glucanase BoGH5A n=1 Tax=mine drainage metagenome TaxID=410659 RepID=A0A1J5RYC7_9ZZZZ